MYTNTNILGLVITKSLYGHRFLITPGLSEGTVYLRDLGCNIVLRRSWRRNEKELYYAHTVAKALNTGKWYCLIPGMKSRFMHKLPENKAREYLTPLNVYNRLKNLATELNEMYYELYTKKYRIKDPKYGYFYIKAAKTANITI